MGQWGVFQNAGVLVVLVTTIFKIQLESETKIIRNLGVGAS